MNDIGLNNVSTVRRNENLSMSRHFMDMDLVISEEFAANALDTNLFPESSKHLRDLVRAAYTEVQQGATIRHTLQVVTGRKSPDEAPSAEPHHQTPTIVFVPDAFHVEAHFVPLCELLNQASFPMAVIDLPTTARAKTASYVEDVHAIRSLLEKLIEEGKEVILAAHSYGGVPACQSVSGFERSKRQSQGKPGGVVHVLFVTALLVEQNRRMVEALEGGKAPSWAVFRVSFIFETRPHRVDGQSSFVCRRFTVKIRTDPMVDPGWTAPPHQHSIGILQRPLFRGVRTWELLACSQVSEQDIHRCG